MNNRALRYAARAGKRYTQLKRKKPHIVVEVARAAGELTYRAHLAYRANRNGTRYFDSMRESLNAIASFPVFTGER